MKKRLGPVIFCLLALLALSGCGSNSGTTPPPPPKPEFLYAMTLPAPTPGASFQLTTYKVDTISGALSSSGTTKFSGPLVPQVTVDPSSKYLYISFPSPGAGAIGIFTIDPSTGVPTQTSTFVVTQICISCPPISGPGVLSLDPAGKFLFYGSSTLGTGVFEGIGALGVNGATGALSGVTGSPFPGDDAPFFVRVHPSGHFLYTENIDPTGASGITLQSVSGFAIDPNTGALTVPVPGSPYSPQVSSTIGGLAVHPSGNYIYATTGLSMNGIMGWSIDAAGALTALSNSPFQPGSAASGVGSFDPTGNFFYVSGGGGGRGIMGFSVDASGGLMPLSTSPFALGASVTSPVIDPTGKFLFAGDTLNKVILTFSIDSATGTLTPVGPATQIAAPPFVLTIVKAP